MTQIDNSRSSSRLTPGKRLENSASSEALARVKPARKRATAQIPTTQRSRSDRRRVRRRAPQQQRSEDTLLAIVKAAEQLLVRVGYARASTNQIARRAGVSVGSLYQYFDDKEAVFAAVVERHKQEVKPLIFAALNEMADPERDLVDVALELMRQMAQANARNPKLMFAIIHELGWVQFPIC